MRIFPSELRVMVCDALTAKGLVLEDLTQRIGRLARARLRGQLQRSPEAFNPGFYDLMEGFETVGLCFCGHKNAWSFVRVVTRTADRWGAARLASISKISRSTLWRVTTGNPFSVRVALDLAYGMRVPVCVVQSRVLWVVPESKPQPGPDSEISPDTQFSSE